MKEIAQIVWNTIVTIATAFHLFIAGICKEAGISYIWVYAVIVVLMIIWIITQKNRRH